MTRVARHGGEEDEADREFFRRFEDVERLFERMVQDVLGRGSPPGPETEPLVFGFSAQVGPQGHPVVREFGNLRPGPQGIARENAREPFTSTVVDEARGEVVVTTELPGVAKEDVKLDATPNALHIAAAGPQRRYRASVDMPAPVDPDSAKATFKNGILDVRVKLREPAGDQSAGGRPVDVD